METKGGFYITQIKQLQDRIFERLLVENGIEISGGQGRSNRSGLLCVEIYCGKGETLL